MTRLYLNLLVYKVGKVLKVLKVYKVYKVNGVHKVIIKPDIILEISSLKLNNISKFSFEI